MKTILKKTFPQVSTLTLFLVFIFLTATYPKLIKKINKKTENSDTVGVKPEAVIHPPGVKKFK